MTTEIEPYSMMQSLVAAATSTELAWLTSLEIVIFCISFVIFLLLNAFFVASEFAIVKVRPSQIETLATTQPVKAMKAQRVVDNLDAYLSANQLGITLASLGLAVFCEPYITQFILAVFGLGFEQWFGVTWFVEGSATLGVLKTVLPWVVLAFFTIFHVVVGELIPKAVAIRLPLHVTIALSPSLHLFYIVFYKTGVIPLLNGTANFCLKKFFRIDPVKESEHAHSSEELALLVVESGDNQEVTDTEREILINALELNDVYVKDVMTPRSDIVALDVEADFEENLRIASESKHTRFPLVKGHLDETIGLIHIKDILTLVGQGETDLMQIRREIISVPESMPLDVLLKFFQNKHEHLAMSVNEYGELSGLVFMDNVIEELVGDIQDEFDDEDENEEFHRVNDSEFIVDGTLSLNSLESYVPELDLHGAEMTTIGGYITQKMERFPEENETLRVLEYEAKVLSTDDRKVGQIHFRKLSEEELTEEPDEGAA